MLCLRAGSVVGRWLISESMMCLCKGCQELLGDMGDFYAGA